MSIYIIDQNEKLAQSIKDGPDIIVLDDPLKALNSLSDCNGGILFLHYDLLKKESSDFIRGLLQYNQNLVIIVIGNKLSQTEIIECIMAGAKGYEELVLLSKYIRRLIRAVGLGEAWLSRRLVAKLIDYASGLKQETVY